MVILSFLIEGEKTRQAAGICWGNRRRVERNASWLIFRGDWRGFACWGSAEPAIRNFQTPCRDLFSVLFGRRSPTIELHGDVPAHRRTGQGVVSYPNPREVADFVAQRSTFAPDKSRSLAPTPGHATTVTGAAAKQGIAGRKSCPTIRSQPPPPCCATAASLSRRRVSPRRPKRDNVLAAPARAPASRARRA
jgi:hypothetical protein